MKKQNEIITKSEIKKAKTVPERIRLCTLFAKANGHDIRTIASILRISEDSVKKYLEESPIEETR